MLFGLFLAASLWAAPPSVDPRPAIAAAAAARPDAAFESDAALPDGFRAYLKSKGYPSGAFTNRRVLELLDEYLKSQPRPAPPVPSKAFDKLGEKTAPVPPPAENVDIQPGLEFFGLQFGSDPNSFQRRNEPYWHKGVDRPKQWSIGPNLALDGLGGHVDYRNPKFRKISVGFMKYWDWPAAIGLDGPRDKVYSWLGQVPSKPTGGFQAGASGALNEYLGGRTLFDWRQATQGTQTNDIKRLTLGTGFSPLGDNPGKRWNVTLLSDIVWEDGKIQQPGYDVNRTGFGYSVGAAFQYALIGLAGPWMPPPPVHKSQAPDAKDNTAPPWIYFDRVQTKLFAAQSPLSSFGITTAAEISFYLFDTVKLIPGLSVTYKPQPDPGLPGENHWGAGFNLGLDLKTH